MLTNDIAATALWWFYVTLIGWAAWPLAAVALRWLPDRAYSLSKPIGLLLMGYVFWLLGAFGFLTVSPGGAMVALAAVVLLSAIVTAQTGSGPALRDWLRDHWRTVLVTEAVFLVAFALFAWVRALNPELVATEKPMEFAFLNSILETGTQPPRDPWLAGYAISYYYFGYILVAMLTTMTAVLPSVAFNLGIALLFALTVVASFGVALNLISATSRASNPGPDKPRAALLRTLSALLAPMLVVVSGNFNGFLETLHFRGVDPSNSGLWRALHSAGLFPENFWVWLNIKFTDLPPVPPTSDRLIPNRYLWWWQSSRILRDSDLLGTPIGLNPIDEFPFFSFLLADMHPHVLALPFVVTAIGLALALYLGVRSGKLAGRSPWVPLPPLYLVGFGVALGGLSFLNTWDFPIYVFVTVAAFVVARLQFVASSQPAVHDSTAVETNNGPAEWRRQADTWTAGVALGLWLVLLGVLLYLPWYIGFSSQAGGIAPNPVYSTRLPQFVVMFGPALVLLLAWLGWLAWQRVQWSPRNYALLGGMVLLLLGDWMLLNFVSGVAVVVVLQLALMVALVVLAWLLLGDNAGFNPLVGLGGGFGLLVVLALLCAVTTSYIVLRANDSQAFAAAVASAIGSFDINTATSAILLRRFGEGLWVPLLLSGVLTLAAGIVFSQKSVTRSDDGSNSMLPFVLLLAATGALLTLGVEFVYLRDSFGVRMNTVFKFYYQAWVLWSVAAAFGTWQLLRFARSLPGRVVFATVAAAVLVMGLTYTVFATYTKTEGFAGTTIDASGERYATLDSMAYMSSRRAEDYAAIQWLWRNVDSDVVIAEAVGGSYSEFARISTHTGLQTVLGWPGHQLQWRGGFEESAGREEKVATLYASRDWSQATPVLNEFDIDYVYVGPLEIAAYGQTGLAKFDTFMDKIYDADGVRIYRRR